MINVLVIGGGLAGAATAIALAQAGRNVTLVEREASPHHKVCGEFLSYEACHFLHRLGLEPQALGAVPIDRVRVAGANAATDHALPFRAWSLSRLILDEAVLARASDCGVAVMRGQAVTALEGRRGAWVAKLADGRALKAGEVVLATGKHDLRRFPRKAGRQNDLVGFKMHYRLGVESRAGLGHAVELFLFPGGYGGLEPVENGTANLCLLISKAALARVGGAWTAVVAHASAHCPYLAARLKGGMPLFDKPLAVASIPYGMIAGRDDGLWRVGDQAAVIPSFSGDGMSISLFSAAHVVQEMLAGAPPHEAQGRLSVIVAPQIGRAVCLSRFMVTPAGYRLVPLITRLIPRLPALVALATRLPAAIVPRSSLGTRAHPAYSQAAPLKE